MGWWTTNKTGESFAENTDGPDMLWGDGPADVLDDALGEIVTIFKESTGREPTVDELKAGLLFSLGNPHLLSD